jgi:hypothetical protein
MPHPFSLPALRRLAALAPFAVATGVLAFAAFVSYPRKPSSVPPDAEEVLVVSLAEIKQFGGPDVRWQDLQGYYGLSPNQISRSIALTAERNGRSKARNASSDTMAEGRVADSGDPIVISLTSYATSSHIND